MSQIGALRRLAHLAARRRGEKRRGEGVELLRAHAVAEIDAVDDVAPLVRAAHLQPAVAPLREFDEVVGLQDHVVEFEEGQRLLAIEPELDRIEGEHAVDGEMAADVAQELQVVDAAQPVGVVEHQRVGRAAAVSQIVGEDLLERGDVLLDRLDRHELARLVLEGGVADHAGAAAHQGDRPVPRLLQPVEQHDLDQRAGMQARGRRVEADIGGHGLLLQ